MKYFTSVIIMISLLLSSSITFAAQKDGVRIKNLGRIDGVRDNLLVGYGLITGLAGTGDTRRSRSTLQSVSNLLQDLGVNVSSDDVNSRNVAAVTVTATLPPFTRGGDKLDVNVSSMGDARSLHGGTLLLTALYGPDRKIHALAQGQLVVGGYKFELNGNSVQKNHPTSGTVAAGALVESSITTTVMKEGEFIHFLLNSPDYTTSDRVVEKVNAAFPASRAKAVDAGRIKIKVPESEKDNLVRFIARIENLSVPPDQSSKIVVNEKTGTVVSGGDVRISQVNVSHGNIKVVINTEYLVSQPNAGYINRGRNAGRTVVVPQTDIEVEEDLVQNISLQEGASVADLVASLNKIKTTTRDMISILQGIKRAGALHAELIIQ